MKVKEHAFRCPFKIIAFYQLKCKIVVFHETWREKEDFPPSYPPVNKQEHSNGRPLIPIWNAFMYHVSSFKSFNNITCYFVMFDFLLCWRISEKFAHSQWYDDPPGDSQKGYAIYLGICQRTKPFVILKWSYCPPKKIQYTYPWRTSTPPPKKIGWICRCFSNFQVLCILIFRQFSRPWHRGRACYSRRGRARRKRRRRGGGSSRVGRRVVGFPVVFWNEPGSNIVLGLSNLNITHTYTSIYIYIYLYIYIYIYIEKKNIYIDLPERADLDQV